MGNMVYTLPDTDDFRKAVELLDILKEGGFKAFLVGGFVRRLFSGEENNTDFDITTDGLPEDISAYLTLRGYEIIPTGIKHGTVTAVIKDPLLTFEITTFRTESTYSDGRHPDSVKFVRKLEDDLSRRDFTVNAMAWNPDSGITDLFGGIKDIENKIIRTVGEPDRRFSEDALRILRAIRFTARLGYSIEENTKESMHRNAYLVKNLANERIQAELVKILSGKYAADAIREFTDVFTQFIPEIIPAIGFCQHTQYHIYDVWEHTLKAIEYSENSEILRIALLLHDIGKPECYTPGGHFYGHASRSAEIAETILRRLCFPNSITEKVTELIKIHCDPLPENEKQMKRLLSKRGSDTVFLLLLHHRADNLAQNPEFAGERLSNLDRLTEMAGKILTDNECLTLKKLAINGNDLISAGFLPGPEIGKLLNEMLSAVIDGKLKNTKEELLNYAELHKAV